MVDAVPQLRRTVQFFFGVQAVGSMIGIVGVLAVFLRHGRDLREMEHGNFIFGLMIVTNLIFVVFGSIPAIAWWTLRAGRPSARVWGIVASVVSLPIPLLSAFQPWIIPAARLPFPSYLPGTLIGVAGLIAFWRSERRVAVPKRVPIRIAGDGTSKIKDYAGPGASIAIVWLSFWMWGRWSTHHHLVYPGLIAFVVEIELAILLGTFAHELGHLYAGWASRKTLRFFEAGPFKWAIRNGVWRFNFNLRCFYGGGVGMVASDLRNMRSRKAFSLIGGPVASLVMASIFMLAAMVAPGRPWQAWWLFFTMVSTYSMVGFLVNLIPLKPEGNYSDGAQLYQIVTNGPWACVHFAFAMVTASLVSAIRPRDYDVNVILRAADSVPRGERGLLLRLFACHHHLDVNRIPQAMDMMQEAEALYEQSIFENPHDICAEFVFLNAFYKRDLLAAELWSARMRAARKVDRDSDYFKARCALHWLRGEREQALEAWERGDALALKLPEAGAYQFTRSAFAQLRAALDAPALTVPPPLESLNALARVCESQAPALPMIPVLSS